MHQGHFVFSQLMQHLPWHTFRRLVRKYDGNRYVKRFSCSDQFLCMAFAQLTGRESLRDIEVCLRAHARSGTPTISHDPGHPLFDPESPDRNL